MAEEACLYDIQVIGEAVSHLPDDLKREESHIPWALIKGMRNRLIHEYFGTDLPVVWNVIKNELPSFKNELERIQLQLLKKEDNNQEPAFQALYSCLLSCSCCSSTFAYYAHLPWCKIR